MIYSPRIAWGRWYEDTELDAMRLRGILEHFTQVNVAILRKYPSLPGAYEAARAVGLRYGFRAAPSDTRDPLIHFGDLWSVLEERIASCGRLATYRAAELRVRYGVHAVCDFEVARGAARDEYHIIVVRPDGREDPSRALGMRG